MANEEKRKRNSNSGVLIIFFDGIVWQKEPDMQEYLVTLDMITREIILYKGNFKYNNLP